MPTIVQEYYIPGDKFPEYIILVIFLILVIGVWTIILYFSSKGTTTVTGGITKAYLTCPATECPTMKTTGEKRCPTNQQLGLQYDPQFEVCNPPNSCTNARTPYAVNPDGSVNIDGVCESKSPNCRCVNYLSTPSYVESIFQVNGDSLYTSFINQSVNTYITQTPSRYAGQGNNIPIVYNSFKTQFWEINPSILYYLTQNPCSTNYGAGPELTNPELLKCINLNPCTNGRMAYVTDNSAAFVEAVKPTADFKPDSYSVACVVNSVENAPVSNSNTCNTSSGKQYAPFFNPTTGQIYCKLTDLDQPT